VSDLGPFWMVLSALQLTGAAYVVAAVATWRGERLWRVPGPPLGWLATLLALAFVAAGVAAIVAVDDVEFSRFVGTGALMVAALLSVLRLLRRG